MRVTYLLIRLKISLLTNVGGAGNVAGNVAANDSAVIGCHFTTYEINVVPSRYLWGKHIEIIEPVVNLTTLAVVL